MLALYIVSGIAVLLLLLALMKISLRVTVDNEISVKLFIGLIPLTLVSQKEKPLKLSDFEIKRFRKKRLKEEEKPKRKKLKQAKKAKKTEGKAEKEKKSFDEILAFVSGLYEFVISDTLEKFGRYLSVKVKRLVITVGGDDAAKTALTYGALSQTVAYFLELINQAKKVRIGNPVGVSCDFTAQKPSADIKTVFSLRVWQIVSVGLIGLNRYRRFTK